MPLVNGDVKALEWRAACWLANDKTGIKEIWDNVDVHDDNRKRFELPDRVTAKRWLFKTLFGGTPYGMSIDPNFSHIKGSEKFWTAVLDEFYKKYEGIARWHQNIIAGVKKTRKLESPSGRYYLFEPKETKYGTKWPEAQIKDYLPQGFGADVVMLLRIAVFRKLYPYREDGILLVNTVHDSLVVDCRTEHVPFVRQTFIDTTERLPEMISKCFAVDFKVPMAIEVQSGMNYRDLEDL